MPPYPNTQNYYPYPQTQYQDRLMQLQNNYQQAVGTLPQAPQVNQGLLWVSGEIGAKSYLVAPNSTVLLMDSDAERFYLKSADNAGMPNLRIFEYKEVTNMPQNAPQAPNFDENILNDKFVTRGEYEDLKSQYKSLLERLDSIYADNAESATKPKSRGRGGNGNEQSNI